MDYDIEYFEDKTGCKNARGFVFDYLKNKNRILFKKCLSWIGKLKDKNNHGEPRTKKLENGIFELKVDSVRITFAFSKDGTIYLLSGFIKKSGKIKSKDLNFVRIIYKEFLEKEKEKEKKNEKN